MTAVAVWTHRPTEDELLDARLRRGWRPTASALRDGDRVLGYAACVVAGTTHTTAARGPSASADREDDEHD